MWSSCMKDCSFYYDRPIQQDKDEMRKKLQFRYDNLFQDYWRPALDNRTDLVMWACEQHNEWLEKKGGETYNCNANTLLSKFGPDYSKIQKKLGSVRGLFDS